MNRRRLLKAIGVSGVVAGTAGCLDTGPDAGDYLESTQGQGASEPIDHVPISISDIVPDGTIGSILRDEPPYTISTDTSTGSTPGSCSAIIIDKERQEIVYPDIDIDNKYDLIEFNFKYGSPTIEITEDDNFVAAVGTYNGGAHLDQVTLPTGGGGFSASIASEGDQPMSRGDFPISRIPELIDAMLQERDIFADRPSVSNQEVYNGIVYSKVSVMLALISAHDILDESTHSASELFNAVSLKYACDQFSSRTNEELDNKIDKVVDLMIQVLAYKSGLPRDPLSQVGDELLTKNEKVTVETLSNQAKFVEQNVVEIPYRLSVEIDVGFNYQLVNYDIIKFESPIYTARYEYVRPGVSHDSDWEFQEMNKLIQGLNTDVPNSIESFLVEFINST